MRVYVYILGRDMIVCASHDVGHIFQLAIRDSIGEPYWGGWRRIQVWEFGTMINHITVNGNHMVKMPKDADELWEMLNE